VTLFWNIDYEIDFVEQICYFPIEEQTRIQNEVVKLAKLEDPRSIGNSTDCGKDDEECPYIVQNLPGLLFEFMYELNPTEHQLTFINIRKVTFETYSS